MRASIIAGIVLILAIGSALFGQATPGLEFTLISGGAGYAVSQGTCNATVVEVPEIYSGLPVTQVAKRGFQDYANLTSISLPNTIAVIDTFAFFNCTSLASFTIPTSVETIYTNPFMKCTNLNSLTVAQGNTAFAVAGNSLIRLADNSVVTGFANSVIPEYVQVIDDYAFGNIATLTNINIPAGVVRIGEYAFTTTGLSSVFIPSSVQLIGKAAFSMCMNLQTVTLAGESQAFIGYGAFMTSTQLVSINLPPNLAGIDAYAFAMCSGLTSIAIPEGISTIEEATFYLCDSLVDITIPESVTVIGKGAFTGCGMTTLELPSGLTFIGDSAFCFCPNLTALVLPASMEYIDDWAFAFSFTMTEINIPLGVSYIGDSAFSGCGSLIISAEASSQPASWHPNWNPDGCQVIWGSSSCYEDIIIPSVAELHANYPNPFNPSTTISFNINKPSPVTIDIFNSKGQRVKRLVNGNMSAGSHNVVWNGVDETGNAVSSGMYFYKMTSNGFSAMKKMTMVK